MKKFILKLLNAVPVETHDRLYAKLGAIIENHMDDETWLMRKIGIDNHYAYRKDCFIDRKKINDFLTPNIKVRG